MSQRADGQEETATKPTRCVASFEESLDELEKIVAELESGKLGLSDALARYEQGVKHLKACQQLLERAERKIELLSGVDADGNPITQPFDEGDDRFAGGKGGRTRPAPHERHEIAVRPNVASATTT